MGQRGARRLGIGTEHDLVFGVAEHHALRKAADRQVGRIEQMAVNVDDGRTGPGRWARISASAPGQPPG